MADGLLDRIGARFARVESRSHARELVLGLLGGLPRKNCWTLAEQAGHARPDQLQYLLGRASWDTDGVRDDLRDYVVEYLGDPAGVLVVDETGDLKKGASTVGVQRQYTGTAGRIENAQVAVYLTYAGPPATPCSTASSTCRAPGPMTPSDARPRGSPSRSSSRPNRPWPET